MASIDAPPPRVSAAEKPATAVGRFLTAELFGEVGAVTPITMGLSGATVYAVATATGDDIPGIHHGDRAFWVRLRAMQRLALLRLCDPAGSALATA